MTMETTGSVDTLEGIELTASLTAKDLAASVAWYRDVAGFTVVQQYERGGKVMAISLRAGNAKILITQDDGAKGFDRVKGEGFSLMITTKQNIDAVANGIKERGGVLDMEPTDTPFGMRVFRLHDPDGFKFAISSERP